MTVNQIPVERIYPNDPRVKPQTVAHHVARYRWACTFPVAENAAALDLGCGSGYGSEMLREAGYKATGVDISQEAIKWARERYPNITFINAPAEQFYFETYDLVILFEVLEHFDYSTGVKILEKISKSLNLKGIFLVSIARDSNPIYNRFHKSLWSYDLLNEMLKALFKKVEIIGQDWDTAEISKLEVIKNDFYLAICSND